MLAKWFVYTGTGIERSMIFGTQRCMLGGVSQSGSADEMCPRVMHCKIYNLHGSELAVRPLCCEPSTEPSQMP